MIVNPSQCDAIESCVQSDCTDRFSGVRILPRVRGGTTVQWSFASTGMSPPVEFRLEFANTQIDQQAWTPVTLWQPDIMAAIDPEVRSFGFLRLAHYRVAAKDDSGKIVYSEPVAARQNFPSPSHELTFRDIVRRERRHQQTPNSGTAKGFLLKVRYYGSPCPECFDETLQTPTRSDCPRCFGVGRQFGYHYPVPCFNVDIRGGDHDLQMLNTQPPSVTGLQYAIRYLNIPEVSPWDVWVDASTDDRYMFGQIKPIASVGSYPVVCQAAASRLSYDHPVYRVPVHVDQQPYMFFVN